MDQRKIIAYAKVKVEITVEGDEEASIAVDNFLIDALAEDHMTVETIDVYSDELIRG